MKFIFRDEAKTILFRVPAVTSLTIPLSVREIYGKNKEDHAFFDAKNVVTDVTFETNNIIETISEYAFYECKKLKSVDLSSCTKLNSIGEYAFYKCESITSFTFPTGCLQTIGQYCFENCTSLTSIDFPGSVTKVGVRLFCYCISLTTANFDQNSLLATLEWGAFYRCGNLTTITIPEKMTYIQNCFSSNVKLLNIGVSNLNEKLQSIDGVVYSKDGLKLSQFPLGRTGSYIVKDNVQEIMHCAFNSALITEIVLPSSLTKISSYAFSDARIKNINIPTGIEEIEQYAFSSSSLEEIIFPEKVNIIGDEILSQCKNLTHVHMPKSYVSLGGGIFAGCSADLRITHDQDSDFQVTDDKFVYGKLQKQVLAYFGTAKHIVILKSVEEIGQKAFFENKYIETIEFQKPPSIKTIARDAFLSSSITSIEIPSPINLIARYAFSKCYSLTSVDLGSSLKRVNDNAFYACTKLVSVAFHNNNVPCEIEGYTFNKCYRLSTVNLGNNIINISEYMFGSCYELKTLAIPSSVKDIHSFAFADSGLEILRISPTASLDSLPSHMCFHCPNLTTIQLPNSITSFGTYCLSGTKIVNFTLPNNVQIISEYCFKDCSEMVTFHINADSKLQKIQYGVFAGCLNFEKITCESTEFSVSSGALYDKNETRLIVVPPKLKMKFFAFPDSLKTIGENAFLGCVNIHQIFIPSYSVTDIEDNVFEGCANLNYINIPICVKNVGKEAFKGCEKLKCGLQIETDDQTFINNLIDKALLPRECLKDCAHFCTHKKSYRFPAILSSIVSIYLICN